MEDHGVDQLRMRPDKALLPHKILALVVPSSQDNCSDSVYPHSRKRTHLLHLALCYHTTRSKHQNIEIYMSMYIAQNALRRSFPVLLLGPFTDIVAVAAAEPALTCSSIIFQLFLNFSSLSSRLPLTSQSLHKSPIYMLIITSPSPRLQNFILSSLLLSNPTISLLNSILPHTNLHQPSK